jgi:hypothetical protein
MLIKTNFFVIAAIIWISPGTTNAQQQNTDKKYNLDKMETEFTPILACMLTTQEQKARSKELKKLLFPKVQSTKELKDGYALIFNNEEKLTFLLLEFINFERNCCPPFRFVLQFEPNQGPIELHMTGSPEIKELVKFITEEVKESGK